MQRICKDMQGICEDVQMICKGYANDVQYIKDTQRMCNDMHRTYKGYAKDIQMIDKLYAMICKGWTRIGVDVQGNTSICNYMQ